jgi:DNA-binding NarL/FixJ family response regulator
MSNVPALDNAKGKSIRILIVDDHAVVRRGVRTVLESESDLEVCAEATNGLEAIDCVRKHKPHFVILDLTMPDLNGLDALREIRRVEPKSLVVIFSMHFSEDVASEAFRSGAQGYVLKSDADSELIAAIRDIQRNRPFVTRRLAASMLDAFVLQDLHGANFRPIDGPNLTVREVEIIRLLAEGKSNKQIAPVLGISPRTVESHRNRIMHKMKFASFSDLMKFAVRNGIVDCHSPETALEQVAAAASDGPHPSNRRFPVVTKPERAKN